MNAGEVVPSAAVLWAHASPGAVRVEVARDSRFDGLVFSRAARTERAHDGTVRVKVTGLRSGTSYFYRFAALQRLCIHRLLQRLGRPRIHQPLHAGRERSGLRSSARAFAFSGLRDVDSAADRMVPAAIRSSERMRQRMRFMGDGACDRPAGLDEVEGEAATGATERFLPVGTDVWILDHDGREADEGPLLAPVGRRMIAASGRIAGGAPPPSAP